jgi:hypothetical protein
MNKIEAIVICDGYADFLRETLPANLPHFERVVVVTGYDDRETLDLCRQLSVECIPTDVQHKDGDAFNKGRMVDLGLSYCRRDDWVLHLDADMYLPPMTRRLIEWANPDPACIYGVDRVRCIGWHNWQRYLSQHPTRRTGHDYHCRVNPPDMPLGARIAYADHDGYVPIGFFQLFHGSHKRRYPRHQAESAEHTDVLFSLQWPRDKRRLLEEVIGIHLESEEAPLGANWKGRRTKRFEYERNLGASACDECNYQP